MDAATAISSAERVDIRAQPGKQELFLATSADIAIYGGARGGGKSVGLLLEPLRHVNNRGFGAVVFRRTSPQITNEGGLWDESEKLYPLLAAYPRVSQLEWVFASGARVRFAHLEHDKSILEWHGAQIPLLCFDELTNFTKRQFFYMLACNRSTCGVRPYVRATCNPDADSWVAEFIAWWIDPETGYPIEERAGVLRWFMRAGDDLFWYDTREAAQAARVELGLPDDVQPTSLTFIPARLDDNPALLAKDPGYRARLYSLPMVERERFLRGNWKIRPQAGTVFQAAWFETVATAPAEAAARIRMWDLAATEVSTTNPDPDWTVGLRLMRAKDSGLYFVEHVARMRASSSKVEAAWTNTASSEPDVLIGFFRDPAQAGKWQAEYIVRQLAGYNVRIFPISGDKLTLAGPVSAQAEAGNIKIVKGPWNAAFLSTLESFDGSGKVHDDDVDALSGAFNALAGVQRWTAV